MRSISVALAAHLASDFHTLATCWRITWKDGTVFGFTDHDQDITFSGVVYASTQGYVASDIDGTCSLEVDNLDLQGVIASPSITRDDLLTGKWDNARILITIVNWADISMGGLVQREGWLGAVTLFRGKFKAELRGLKQAYTTTVVQLVSPTCRNTLGVVDIKRGTRCAVVLGNSGSPSGGASPGYLYNGTVDSIDTDQVTIHDATRTEGTHPSGTALFIGGLLRWKTGLNTGLSMEIREATTGVLQLGTAMYYEVMAGDTYEITPGCSKLLEDCIGTFGAKDYFNGEPHLGGNDLLFQQAREI